MVYCALHSATPAPAVALVALAATLSCGAPSPGGRDGSSANVGSANVGRVVSRPRSSSAPNVSQDSPARPPRMSSSAVSDSAMGVRLIVDGLACDPEEVPEGSPMAGRLMIIAADSGRLPSGVRADSAFIRFDGTDWRTGLRSATREPTDRSRELRLYVFGGPKCGRDGGTAQVTVLVNVRGQPLLLHAPPVRVGSGS